ncbi:MAG: hypothetical protein FJY97_02935 [candidate division Zixibacteria bacterium]|nr:hypothetical protein [candidate division Zixibacteria bacterium]
MLGFIRNKEKLRALKKTLARSNTRGVYKGDDHDRWMAGHPAILGSSESKADAGN